MMGTAVEVSEAALLAALSGLVVQYLLGLKTYLALYPSHAIQSLHF